MSYKKTSASSFNPEALIETATEVSQIMHEEISLLKQMRIIELQKYQARKDQLTTRLENFQKQLQQNPTLLNVLSPSYKGKISSVLEDFENIRTEYNLQFRKVTKVYQILVDTIKKSIDKQVPNGSVYNNQGIVTKKTDKIEKNTPLALNESY